MGVASSLADEFLKFMEMEGTHNARVVARFELDGQLCVDTSAVNDPEQPYETAISHMDYNEGRWIIVEMYEDKESAKLGHEVWVAHMTTEPLPISLRDCTTSTVGEWADDAHGEEWRVFPRTLQGETRELGADTAQIGDGKT